MLTVERRCQRFGKDEHRSIQHRRDGKRSHRAPAEQPPELFPVVHARAAADERLHPGTQTGENGNAHQREVRDHAVSRHARIARKAQQHQIEQQQHHARGDLTDERGQARRTQRGHAAHAQACSDRVEASCRSAQMRTQHENADKRRKARRQRRAEHSQSAREDEDVVEHDIEQAARDHAAHSDGRCAVVARERQQHVVHHEERPEAPQHTEVRRCHFERLCIRAEQPRDGLCEAQSTDQEQQTQQQTERRRVREHAVRLLPVVLRPRYGVLRGRAHADHQADAVHQVVRRYGDVERCQSERTRALCHKIGIREDVARNADHAQYVHHRIVPEFPQCALFLHPKLPF